MVEKNRHLHQRDFWAPSISPMLNFEFWPKEVAKLESKEEIYSDGLREQDDGDNADASKNTYQTTWETDCYLPRSSTTRNDPHTLNPLLWS